jgi:hypothetical protein
MTFDPLDSCSFYFAVVNICLTKKYEGWIIDSHLKMANICYLINFFAICSVLFRGVTAIFFLYSAKWIEPYKRLISGLKHALVGSIIADLGGHMSTTIQ